MALNTTPFVSGSILTAAQMSNLPMGIAGKSTLATDVGFTVLQDLGLSVTWTAVASRQYKLSFSLNWDSDASANLQFFITNSANTAITEALVKTGGANFDCASAFGLVTGISGSVTYKMRAAVSAGNGVVYGASIRPALAAVFMVEDVGAA